MAPTSFVGSGFLMAKYVFFVDGFNLYHALDYLRVATDHYRYRKYKWLNLHKLCSLYVGRLDSLEKVVLFTALATWDADKVARHKLFIRANEAAGVSVVYGEFKRKEKHCTLCHGRYPTFEEKQTDVNIALGLFQHAVADQYDRAVLVSGDTDLIPAIKAVRATLPHKQIGVMLPIGRASADLIKNADFRFKMNEYQLKSARFPDQIILPDKSTLDCPKNWK